MVAGINASDAFFAPLTVIGPLRGRFPVMTNLSMPSVRDEGDARSL
jgi:hypothetical protein